MSDQVKRDLQNAAAFDRAYAAIIAADELALARKKLSLHEIRTLLRIASEAFAGVAWQPMHTLPDDGGIHKNMPAKLTVLAITADGRVMQMPPWMLRGQERTPGHLRFPAVGWMPLPAPPTESASESIR